MTITTETPQWGGLLFFRPEPTTFRGRDGWSGSMVISPPREIDGTVAGCPGCGWSGAPTIVAGERSTFCPSCESEGTEPGEAPLLVAGPEDVYARGPWARLTRRGERGELYRPRPARPAYQRAPLGTVQRAGAKVGRNDPCPCGSGKKHKRCCG